MEMLSGNGHPSRRMFGEVGQHYKDLNTGDIYECVSSNEHSRVNLKQTGGYIWKKIAHGDHMEVCAGGAGGGGSSVQPDWNQNDPNAADYVKNRTHYADIETQEILSAIAETVDGIANITPDVGFKLEIGKAYEVIFDGETYRCVAWCAYGDTGTVMIGNGDNYGADEFANGEPFVLEWNTYNNKTYLHHEYDGTHSITISAINKEEIGQIEEKYISSAIARKSDINAMVKHRTVHVKAADQPLFNTFNIDLFAGTTYKVVWDDVEYKCVAYIADNMNVPCIGNGALGGITGGNGEPFFIVYDNESVLFAREAGAHTIRVSCDDIFLSDTNGKKWKLVVDTSGVLSAVEVYA